ncbi:MAG: hypothetical protein KBT30_00750, partial [Clostridiales bacterium]|nr:hypothetical protein [Candidatus Apopatousia equi]
MLKKVVSILVIVIVALFAGMVIVSAFIPKNFDINLDAPDKITIWRNSEKYPITKANDTEEYNKIMELYKDGFKTKFLNAFFQGKGFNKMTVIDNRKSLDDATLKKGASDTIYIEFVYNDLKETNLYGHDEIKLTNNEEKY